MGTLWTEKYMPLSRDMFIGNSEIVESAFRWAGEWAQGKRPKPLLFHGQTGSGKTALAYLVAHSHQWEVLEMNASDLRNKEAMEKQMGAAVSNTSFSGKPRLVLVDEVDALQARDRGGMPAILQVLKGACNPVILTANDIYAHPRLSGLRFVASPLEFKKINYLSMAKRMREILSLEQIPYDEEAVKELARHANGDFRSFLLDAQTLSLDVRIEPGNLFYRDRQEKIFKVMAGLFNTPELREARRVKAAAEVNNDLLFRWVEENIPRQYRDPGEMADAFDQLCRAERHNAHIFRTQHYGFLRYYGDLLAVGAGVPRKEKSAAFIPFQFPTLLSKLSRSSAQRAVRRSLALKIGRKLHSSSREVMASDLPFLRHHFPDKEHAIRYITLFDLDEKEVALLLNTSPSTKKVKDLISQAEAYRVERMQAKRKKLPPAHPLASGDAMLTKKETQTSLQGFTSPDS